MATAMHPTRRAGIYARVSTIKQKEEGTSLDTQEVRDRAYCAERGYALDEAHVYRETYSGAELWERPKLNALRAAVRAHAVDVVVCYAIDRLSRDPVHLGVILSEADHAGVAVEFVTEPLDDSPEGQLIRFVRGYAAKVERLKAAERTIRGKRARAEAGKIHRHGSELYGYRRDKARGVRVVHEPEARVVRQIYCWVAEDGCSIHSIIRRLNDEGVPPPSLGKLVYKDGRTTRWGNGAVYRILADPAYKGEAIAWRYRTATKGVAAQRPEAEWLRLPDGTTPAIVSAELWQAAQDRRAANRGATTRNAARPYLLRGLIVCAVCGRPMRTSPEHGRRVYRCSSRETPAGPCGGRRVPADAVEGWLWDRVTAVLRDPSVVAQEVERRRQEGPDERLVAERDAAHRQLTKVERQQERLLRRFRKAEDDGFPWELVEREIARAEDEKKQLRAVVAEAERRIAEREAAIGQMDAIAAYCAKVSANLITLDFAQRRTAIEALVERVVANGREWRWDGSIPISNDMGGPSTSSGRCGNRRRPPPTRA